jgi:hypothetical protein
MMSFYFRCSTFMERGGGWGLHHTIDFFFFFLLSFFFFFPHSWGGKMGGRMIGSFEQTGWSGRAG